MKNAILFLHVLDPGLSANLAPLAQGRDCLAQVLVFLLQALQLKKRLSFIDGLELRLTGDLLSNIRAIRCRELHSRVSLDVVCDGCSLM